MPHFGDDLRLGGARVSPALDPNSGGVAGPSPSDFGVGPMGRVYLWDAGVPAAAAADVIALAQTLAAPGNLVLTAGAGVTSTTNARGERVLQLDVPRCVSLTGVAGTGAVSYTITGYDRYGQRMSQVVAHAGGATTSNTLKAFWQILSIAAAAATTDNISAGISDILGLPVRINDQCYAIFRETGGAPQTLASGTFVAAVTTDPATTATGDVRGTWDPTTALGAIRVTGFLFLPAAACGPNATRAGAFGVNQNLATQ